jgi:tetratricopeptide (TPR) repeat protein
MLKDVSGAAATSPQCRYELARTCYFLGKGPGGQMGRLLPGVGGPRRMEPGPMGFVFDPRGPHHEERGRRERDRGLSSLEPRPFDESQRLHKPGRPDGRRASDPSQPDDDAEPSARQPPDRHEFDGGPPGPPPDFKDGAPGDLAGTPPAEFGGARPSGPADHRPFFHGMHPGEGDDYLQQAIDLLKNLVEEQPNVPEYQHLLARCYREVRPRRFHEGQRPGDRSEEEKKPEAESATVAANKATAIMENLVKAYPTVADYRYDLSETYAMQGRPGPFSRAAEQGDVAQSRKNLEKALAISEELVAEHPNIPDYAASQVQHFLGLTELLWASNTAEAERSLRKAMDLQASLVRRYPQNTSFKVWLAVIHRTQAQFWQESDDLKESERLAKTRDELQESIKLLKEALATDQRAEHIHNVLAEHYLQLARVLRRQGDNHAAAQAEKEAESLRKPWAPPPMAPMAL